ncbi:MAG: OmpH family outer membrane protein [Bacteroidota bacterium]
MKKIIKLSVVLCAFFAFAFSANAQKMGYINSQLLMSEMAEVKEMNANLEALQTQLRKKGQNALTDLQNDYKVIQDKVGKGLLSPKEQEEEGKKLEARQQEIAKMEQDMIKQIQDKQQKLSEPIIAKINDAINAVAKENGYSMIFDSANGMILYSVDENDVSALVKAKLGI